MANSHAMAELNAQPVPCVEVESIQRRINSDVDGGDPRLEEWSISTTKRVSSPTRVLSPQIFSISGPCGSEDEDQ